jgi:predicted nucleic acid-binding protein
MPACQVRPDPVPGQVATLGSKMKLLIQLDNQGRRLVLIDIEVAQTLRRLVSLRQITAARGKQALEDHGALGIKRAEHKDLLERVWTLRDSVTAYDAAYVVLAEILDAPLVTCDAKLARSHGHEARIELIE